MTKTFKTNKNGKIEFTKEQLGKLLDEVWSDGYNSNNKYYWSSPWWGHNWYSNDYITISASDITSGSITYNNTNNDVTWTSGLGE